MYLLNLVQEVAGADAVNAAKNSHALLGAALSVRAYLTGS